VAALWVGLQPDMIHRKMPKRLVETRPAKWPQDDEESGDEAA